MASAVDSRLAYARLSAVATASRLPTANRGSNNSYTTSWDTTTSARSSRNIPAFGSRNSASNKTSTASGTARCCCSAIINASSQALRLPTCWRNRNCPSMRRAPCQKGLDASLDHSITFSDISLSLWYRAQSAAKLCWKRTLPVDPLFRSGHAGGRESRTAASSASNSLLAKLCSKLASRSASFINNLCTLVLSLVQCLQS